MDNSDHNLPRVSGNQIYTSRVIHASREAIFNAITTPDLLAKWWGPKDFTNTFEEIDIKPGGVWRFVMHGPNGANYKNESVFEEVTVPERILIKHISPPEFLLKIELTEQSEGSLLDWLMTFNSPEETNKIRKLVEEGNEQNLDRLAELLAKNS